MKTSRTLQAETHNRILTTRAVEYLILRLEFVDAYDSATEAERELVTGYVETNNIRKLRAWFLANQRLEYLTWRQLTLLAKDCDILGYRKMSITQLRETLNGKCEANRALRTDEGKDRTMAERSSTSGSPEPKIEDADGRRSTPEDSRLNLALVREIPKGGSGTTDTSTTLT